MALMNYTGREAIDRDLIAVVPKKNAPVLTVFLKTQQPLRDNPRFDGCHVVLDAVLRTRAQRMELGPLAELVPSVEIEFGEFLPDDEVQFRLKIVRPADKVITGEVSGLRIKSDKPEEPAPGRRKSLLPVTWATEGDGMKGRFWKVDFTTPQYPVLLIAKGKFAACGDVNNPAFQALAFPAIMKEVLTYAFVTRFCNPPPWTEDWKKLVSLLGCESCPERPEGADSPQEVEEHLESVRKWIDAASAHFASDCHLDSISGDFKRSVP